MEFGLLIAIIVSFIFLYAVLKNEFKRQKLKEPGIQYHNHNLSDTAEHESKLTSTQQPPPINRHPATGNQQPDDSDATIKKPGDFVQQAANACLYMPLIYLLMASITSGVAKQSRFAGLVIGVILILMMISGIIMAVIAMVSYRKHGDKKILKKGIAGFLINGFIIYSIFAVAAASFHTTRKRQEIIKTMQNNMDENVKMIERSLQNENVDEQHLEVLDKTVKNLKEFSETTSHEEAKFVKVLAKVIEQIREPQTEYYSAFSAFDKIGGIDAAEINSIDDINKRLELLNKFEEANEKLDNVSKMLEDHLRKGLLSEGMKPGKADLYLSNWKQEAHLDVIVKIRDTDRRLVKEYRSILNIYITYWDKWAFDSETEELLFESDLAITEYNKHINSIDSISNEQAALQQEMLTSLKNRLKKNWQREDTNRKAD